jgi:hypothetical protein
MLSPANRRIFMPKTRPTPPKDLTPAAAQYFYDLFDLVSLHTSILPADMSLIEAAAFHYQNLSAAAKFSADAFERDDMRAWTSASRTEMAACRGLRATVAALGATPDRRGKKRDQRGQAANVLDGNTDWGDLLG